MVLMGVGEHEPARLPRSASMKRSVGQDHVHAGVVLASGKVTPRSTMSHSRASASPKP